MLKQYVGISNDDSDHLGRREHVLISTAMNSLQGDIVLLRVSVNGSEAS